MADNIQETQVKISGDGTSAQEAMKKAATAVSDGVDRMKGSLSNIEGAFSKVGAALLGLAAIVAGGKFFKQAIDESNKLTSESIKLATSLGITMEEATSLNTALGDIYTDSDTYIGAFQRFAGQLRRNEDGLNALGIKTRDTNGNLLDARTAFEGAIQKTKEYAPGLDQAAFAQKAFGKSIDEVMKLQKLNNELIEDAKRKNEELGLVITDQNVTANEEYKAAMNDVGDVLTAVQKTVGDAVMPVFTELAKYFASTGPYVINLFKGAMTGLLAVFRTVSAVVKAVGQTIFEMLNHMIDQLGNLSDLLAAVFRGDFEEAARIYERMGNRFVQGVKAVATNTKDAFIEAKEAFSEDLDRVWGEKVAAKGAGRLGRESGSKRMGDLKDPKDKKEKDRTGEWEAELEARKIAYQKENDLREMAKEAEFKYWSDILTRKDLTEKEKLSITKKVNATELDMLRDQRNQINALSEEAITAYRNQRLDDLEARRQEYQFQLEQEAITKEQMLELERQMELERYNIQREAIAARLELLKLDPTKNAVALQRLNDELAALEREHQRNMRENQRNIQREQINDWKNFFQTVGQGWGNIINGLVMRTMTFGQAVRNMLQQALGALTNFLGQWLAKKAAAWATEKAMGMAQIGLDAAKAGAGAAASQASIPFAGPALALAAMASVFAAVMGLGGKVPSARGGWSIPSGVNPLTQLHEEEKVLDRDSARVIDDLAKNGSNGAPVVFKGASAGDFFIAHKRELVQFMKSLNRNFEFM